MRTTRKLFSLFVLLIACVFVVHAQTPVKVNPKVGVNVSAIEAQIEDLRTQVRAGWNAGIDFRIGKNAYIAPGIHYYNYTADLVEEVNDVEDFRIQDRASIQSLKVPVNLGLKILGLRAQGGIVPTYVMGVNDVSNTSFNVDNLNRFTWGANVGVGFDLLFLTVDAGYEIGLSDYFKQVEGSNNVLTLSVGLKF